MQENTDIPSVDSTLVTPAPNSGHSINDLFRESIDNLKHSLLSLFILSILSFVIGFLGIILFLVVGGVGFGVGAALSGNPAALIPLIGSAAVAALIFLLAIVFFNSAVYAAQILVLGTYPAHLSVGDALKKGVGLVIPVFVVSLLTGLLSLGGYLLLIIPGIVLTFFLMFSVLAKVLDGYGIVASLRRSVVLISKNFGDVFVKVLLMIGVYIVYEIIMQILTAAAGDSPMVMVFVLLDMIFSFVLSWFFMAYMVTMYKQLSSTVPQGELGKLRWLLLTSVIGWVIGILMFSAIANFVQSEQFQKMFSEGMKSFQSELEKSESTNTDSNLSPEQQQDLDNYLQEYQDQLQNTPPVEEVPQDSTVY